MQNQRRNSRLLNRLLVIVLPAIVPLLLLGLIIPVSGWSSLTYGTYLGAELTEKGLSIAVDAQGRAYVTGYTESTIFPAAIVPIQPEHGIDVYAARFQADGTGTDYVLWFNALSLFQEDYAYGVALGEDNSAYVVGQTYSEDFCAVFGSVPGYDTTYNGGGDAFLLKILPDGSGLAYCTFLGGSEWDSATAVAVDPAGYAYVTGGTWSEDFTTSSNSLADRLYGQRDAYLLQIDPAGTAVVHASFLGGSGQEEARGIALDAASNVYLTGWTNSGDFITTTGVIGPGYGGNFDAFLMKIDTTVPELHFATYLGGIAEDRGYSIAVGPDGAATVSGFTRSDDFPTTGEAYATARAGAQDGFVLRVNPDATDLQFATYLGGSDEDTINGLDLDQAQNSYVTGETWSTDFPTTSHAMSDTLPGGRSAFVTVLGPSGSELVYSSYLGGSDWDQGFAIAVDGDGRVYVAGATRSADFPTSPDAYDRSHNGDYDVFVMSLVEMVVEEEMYWLYLPVILR